MADVLGTEVMHGKDEDELTLNMVRISQPFLLMSLLTDVYILPRRR